MSAPVQAGLPDLPQPMRHFFERPHGECMMEYFDANMMHAYARAAIAQHVSATPGEAVYLAKLAHYQPSEWCEITADSVPYFTETRTLYAARTPAAPAEVPTNEELEAVWYDTHYGHPADFAADVLEHWGGWPAGVLGYGGSGVLLTPAAPVVDLHAAPTPWNVRMGVEVGQLVAPEAAFPYMKAELLDWRARHAAASTPSDLHAAIMALPCDGSAYWADPGQREAHRSGHAIARHAAAELVANGQSEYERGYIAGQEKLEVFAKRALKAEAELVASHAPSVPDRGAA